MTQPRRQVSLLVVMGEGGHSAECLRLVDLLGPSRYRYQYVLVSDDDVTANKLRVPGPVHRLIRPGCQKSSRLADAVRYPICAVQTLRLLLRTRPDAVLTTGPAVAVPVAVFAKLLGIRVLFVETGSRVRHLSATGRFMRRFADLYFIQWEELLPTVPHAIFAGRLL
jgi:beta-1,4-N-acetylglucosaminyltransferase